MDELMIRNEDLVPVNKILNSIKSYLSLASGRGKKEAHVETVIDSIIEASMFENNIKPTTIAQHLNVNRNRTLKIKKRQGTILTLPTK